MKYNYYIDRDSDGAEISRCSGFDSLQEAVEALSKDSDLQEGNGIEFIKSAIIKYNGALNVNICHNDADTDISDEAYESLDKRLHEDLALGRKLLKQLYSDRLMFLVDNFTGEELKAAYLKQKEVTE